MDEIDRMTSISTNLRRFPLTISYRNGKQFFIASVKALLRVNESHSFSIKIRILRYCWFEFEIQGLKFEIDGSNLRQMTKIVILRGYGNEIDEQRSPPINKIADES